MKTLDAMLLGMPTRVIETVAWSASLLGLILAGLLILGVL